MTIVLDHTIVPARDKEESARFFARIFGLEYKGGLAFRPGADQRHADHRFR